MEHKITNELPNIPSGSAEQVQQPAEAMIQSGYNEAQQVKAVETAAPPAQAPNPAQQYAPISPPQVAPTTNGSPAAAMPQIADDADLIEKEWILKAKEIVARTKNDPYAQNKEVELMKADYMKKRYNKDIKITED